MTAATPLVRMARRALRAIPIVLALLLAVPSATLFAQTITRGPYLQVGTPSSIIVRWQTDVSTSGRVWYGTDPGNLAAFVNDAVTGNNHAVTLTGLAPDTRYYYAVGTTSAAIASGASYRFVTSPPAGVSKPTRVWVIGDAGTGTASQAAVRDAYTAFNGTRETDLWLVLGDNAYNSGTEAEYQAKHFAIYPNVLRNSVSWYTLGNHDAGTGAVGAHPYHTLFSFPTAGEAGGVASGTRSYYSFDYGNIHFISLDSQEASRAVGGAMMTWLKSDLQSNTRPWVIAFWHHPPYSKGTHDSDTEINMVEMRANFLPVLEQYGVDLVLAGHSHVYERSYLIDGHYGTSSTFTAAMKLNGGSGRPGDTGAYAKPSIGPVAHEGAVYAVAGSSGQTGSFVASAPHPAMFISLNNLGSMVLDVNGNRLDASFLRENATVADTFTLVKGTVSGNMPPAVAITSPADGSTMASGAIALGATATDSSGIAQVAWYSDGVLVGASASAPFSATWTGAPPGPHRLTARATDTGGLTHISAPVFVTVTAAPPAAPTNLLAGTVTANSVALSWSDNANDETAFVVQRATGAGAFATLVTLGANATAHTDATVAPSTAYSYRVYAQNAAGDSGFSNTIAVTTPAAAAPPAAPTGLAAAPVSGTQINLVWTDNATNETGYKVERSTNGTSFTQIATTGANAASYPATGLSKNRTYYFRVRATNASGDSAYSNVASAKTPRK